MKETDQTIQDERTSSTIIPIINQRENLVHLNVDNGTVKNCEETTSWGKKKRQCTLTDIAEFVFFLVMATCLVMAFMGLLVLIFKLIIMS